MLRDKITEEDATGEDRQGRGGSDPGMVRGGVVGVLRVRAGRLERPPRPHPAELQAVERGQDGVRRRRVRTETRKERAWHVT